MTAQRNNQSESDCLGCRLVGGIGGLGMGTYVFWHLRPARRHPPVHRFIMGAFGATFLFLGATRLLNVWPFTSTNLHKN